MRDIKIPQNIQVADKLLGPFTLYQLFAIAGGGGVTYLLFGSIQKTYGSLPGWSHAIIWWPMILSVAFSMIRINDIPLSRYLLLVIEMMSKPRQRSFQQRRGLVINIQTPSPPRKKKLKSLQEEDLAAKESKSVRLEELSVLLDHEGATVSRAAREDEDDLLLQQTYLDENPTEIRKHEERVDALLQDRRGVSVDPLEMNIDRPLP